MKKTEEEKNNHELVRIIFKGIEEEVKLAISKIKNINAESHDSTHSEYYCCSTRILLIAINLGRLDIIKLLLEKGANLYFIDEDGNNMLHSAAYSSYSLVVKFFINEFKEDSKFGVNSQNKYGKTPLHIISAGKFICGTKNYSVSTQSKKKSTELLLQNGADINAKDNQGNTALHYSITNSLTITKVLLDNEVDIYAKNGYGETPLDLLKETDQTSLVLLNYGIKPEELPFMDQVFNDQDFKKASEMTLLVYKIIDQIFEPNISIEQQEVVNIVQRYLEFKENKGYLNFSKNYDIFKFCFHRALYQHAKDAVNNEKEDIADIITLAYSNMQKLSLFNMVIKEGKSEVNLALAMWQNSIVDKICEDAAIFKSTGILSSHDLQMINLLQATAEIILNDNKEILSIIDDYGRIKPEKLMHLLNVLINNHKKNGVENDQLKYVSNILEELFDQSQLKDSDTEHYQSLDVNIELNNANEKVVLGIAELEN